MELKSKIPDGPVAQKWDTHRFEMKLVNPANKRKYTIIVVGSGLAGGSAAATLSELGYNVKCFCFQDSPRLAQISVEIIDQCVAQGVPFAREYGGLLANRSFGGAQVSRTFYARGQTGQQLLLGAYQALEKEVAKGGVTMLPRMEMLDLIVINGRARGIVARNMVTGKVESYVADAVVLGTGGYGNVFHLSTNAKGSNATAIWRAHKRGALFGNACYTQIHPTCIPVSGEYQSKLTLMSESLRNDGRVWVPKQRGDRRAPHEIPEAERDYYLERKYPSFGNLAPRDIASRAAKEVCDDGRGVGPSGLGVYLDFADAIKRVGEDRIRERYANLFEMYQRITDENPYRMPMRIFPAVHYTMGGLWVDYDPMSTIPGLFVIGEANFSDHGANRLGASALMQGLADGYFILPYTLAGYLAGASLGTVAEDGPEARAAVADVRARVETLLRLEGRRTATDFHRALGHLMWDACGIERSREGLAKAIDEGAALREAFWEDLTVPGEAGELNQELERAGRVADFLELAELMCRDALAREESCGCHFRVEHQTRDGEGLRNDEKFAHVAAWMPAAPGRVPERLVEPLEFESLALRERSYR